jgi:hypothetical protein
MLVMAFAGAVITIKSIIEELSTETLKRGFDNQKQATV